MQATTSCPHCSATFQVPTKVLGKRTRCTKCGQPFVLTEQARPPKIKASADRKELTATIAGAFDDVVSQATDSFGSSPAVVHSENPPPIVSPPQIVAHAISQAPTQSERRGQRRFLALRIVARLIDIYAIALGIFAFAMGLWPIRSVAMKVDAEVLDWFLAITRCLGVWLSGGIVVLVLLFFANLIRLGLQIEQNTFEDRESLRELQSKVERFKSKSPKP